MNKVQPLNDLPDVCECCGSGKPRPRRIEIETPCCKRKVWIDGQTLDYQYVKCGLCTNQYKVTVEDKLVRFRWN
jgi:hypothetical protein